MNRAHARAIQSVLRFLFFNWHLFRLLAENTKETLCKWFSKDCEHKWVQTSNLERKRTAVYATCSRCGAVR